MAWLLRRSTLWRDAIARTMADPTCRYMCIYNWSGIKENRGAIEAIRAAFAFDRQ